MFGSEKRLYHTPALDIRADLPGTVALNDLPLVHVVWSIHINKSRLGLRSLLATGIELREARACADLPRSSAK